MFQISITLVFEVFACCPPGPPLPEKRHRSSPEGMVSSRVTTRSPLTSAIGQAPSARGVVAARLHGNGRGREAGRSCRGGHVATLRLMSGEADDAEGAHRQ